MKKVAWGVLSTANIGISKVLPAMQKAEWCDIRAIASRSLPAAQAAAEKLGIPKAYGSYEELLADPEIEAIYNPLPNDLHVPMTLAAARAGKHVLCEKPIALTASQAEELRAVADKVHITEAFMVRIHPQWQRARELVRSGELGELRTIQTFFSYYNVQPNNIRNRVEVGGGALYDIGCYPIVTARFLFEAEPCRAVALFDRDPMFRTDRNVTAIVDFGEGRRLDFTVSTQSAPYQRVNVVGTKKRLEIHIPFNAVPGQQMRIFLDDGSLPGAAAAVAEEMPACDQYGLQGDAFARVVRGEIKAPYGVEDAIANMRVIDAIFRSDMNGGWENI
ncbi:Gfo/Idh/MocA family protein [Propionivibrio soli]|uniref:Gfo/Idh/MocA family protein n=1 Tax=Propionivibrio soli TaxID=2976531 RepID=UPI0021E950D9|nr:Gfo/Idh/MocA family oxidoreductase [Propionivibrio soli]